MWQFWIDRGGTFTDVVGAKPDGTLVSHKLLSENPRRYADAAVQGVRELLGLKDEEPIPPDTIDAVKMGTTVATNALLERKGDRTLLLITCGFGDLLRIGYQNRPRLFDLEIVLPELLYERVAQIDERVGARGDLVQPLDEAATRDALAAAYEDGIRSVAIAFMHGYRFPAHEARAGELAREAGFTQVSLSHEVSPLMKLVSRGDTTVVDAYLSPVLRRYVNQVRDALGAERGGCRRLMFMQSNGGLTDAELFQGKDAILSGPAGGVVGMVRTAGIAGFDKLIGFDMGGTSTDVCHYAGEYERSFETEVAGVRMRAPMMDIHTVAAGGGSILKFDGERFRVGPDSAGANPGPACYRQGGPLTVTDCNVMLGKIQAEHFPKVFGPGGGEPLDVDIVHEKFGQLALEIARALDTEPMTPQAVAEGFLRIAIENMVNAIKKISVQRGHDVTEYALNCFGGAGGQHACLIADALGMSTVIVHPFAGVLSAYGMGLADIRELREKQVERELDDDAIAEVDALLESLSAEAEQRVRAQGVDAANIERLLKVHLRYESSHHAIEVEHGSVAQLKQRFDEAHRSRYGFTDPQRKVFIEAAAVEIVGHTHAVPETPVSHSATPSAPSPVAQVPLSYGEDEITVPLFQRESLEPGARVTGPALIVEATGTNVVEPGWRAEINAYGHLLLSEADNAERREQIGTSADPIMLEVFNNLFMSIAEQMGATLQNTAYSVNIKERLDFSCALFDAGGALVANAPHVPVHLGSMGEAVKTVVGKNEGNIHPGDVFMLNNPFSGGTHLPDVTVITPVFDESGKTILFYVGSRGHHADIGGRTPGSAPPDSRHIEEEGVVIDNFKLVERGRLRESETRALLGSGTYPCRNIDQNMADLAAQIAANETGVRELRKLVAHFGLETTNAYMRHVQDNAEAAIRRVLGVLKDGQFEYRLDGGEVIKVQIRVDHEQRRADIDFTGTSPQGEGNYNAPRAVCNAAVLYVFRTLVHDDIPLNEGCMKPLNVIVPEGSMLNPRYPAAVISGNTEVSQGITDTLYGALGAMAASQGTMNNFVWGTERFQNYETICGGSGAGPTFDGADAVQVHMTNTRMTDPEVLEWRFPVRLEDFSIRHGSGGTGKHTGGNGVTRRLRFLEPATTTVLTSHRIVPPFGVAGGKPGALGRNVIERADGSVEELAPNDQRDLLANDVFLMETPGGGGYGA